jgi:hypothetical protein
MKPGEFADMWAWGQAIGCVGALVLVVLAWLFGAI